MFRSLPFAVSALSLVAVASSQSRLSPFPQATPALPVAGPVTSFVGPGGCSGQVLWAMTIRGKLYRVDDYTTTPTPQLVYDSGILFCTDIAVHPTTGVIYGYSFGTAGTMDFWSFAPPTYQENLIANFNPPFDQNALDFDANGVLYSRGGGTDISVIDLTTGALTVVGQATAATAGDLAVDLDGTFLGTTSQQTVDQFDPATGTASVLGPHNLGSFLYGIEVDCDGTAYVCNSVGDLYTLDRTTVATTPIGNIAIPGLEPIMGLSFASPADRFGAIYCSPAVANSTGQPAGIEVYGSDVAADDDLTLLARNLPVGEFAYFITSQSQGFVANPGGSQGNLCIGMNTARYISFIGQVDSAGIYSATVGTSVVPTSPVSSINPGETWNFQAWYRDLNPTGTSNFTDGISVLFQ